MACLRWSPCVDVSKLNKHRSGAGGPNSSLFVQFKTIYDFFKQARGDQVKGVMECTPMDRDDMLKFNEVFGSWPWELCSRHWKPVTRRRWWWLDFAPSFPEGTRLERTQSGATRIIPAAERTPLEAIVEPGWWPVALLLNSANEENFEFRCSTRRAPFDKQP